MYGPPHRNYNGRRRISQNGSTDRSNSSGVPGMHRMNQVMNNGLNHGVLASNAPMMNDPMGNAPMGNMSMGSTPMTNTPMTNPPMENMPMGTIGTRSMATNSLGSNSMGNTPMGTTPMGGSEDASGGYFGFQGNTNWNDQRNLLDPVGDLERDLMNVNDRIMLPMDSDQARNSALNDPDADLESQMLGIDQMAMDDDRDSVHMDDPSQMNGSQMNGSPINGGPINGGPLNGSHLNGSLNVSQLNRPPLTRATMSGSRLSAPSRTGPVHNDPHMNDPQMNSNRMNDPMVHNRARMKLEMPDMARNRRFNSLHMSTLPPSIPEEPAMMMPLNRQRRSVPNQVTPISGMHMSTRIHLPHQHPSHGSPHATHAVPSGGHASMHTQNHGHSATHLAMPPAPAENCSIELRKSRLRYKPRSSIPPDLSSANYAAQCIAAAESSRLSPWALHIGELSHLRSHLPYAHVTTYLNVRNGILRLWLANPLVAVTVVEAAGCCKNARYYRLAEFAFAWLERNGYINSGCYLRGSMMSQGPCSATAAQAAELSLHRRKPRQTLVVIGAGVAGLSCARQLENLLERHSYQILQDFEDLPRVIVLEGRKRIGGRVYSPHLRSSKVAVDLGGDTIMGFGGGNPLGLILRRQLGIPVVSIDTVGADNVLYDGETGEPISAQVDYRAHEIFKHLLDRMRNFEMGLGAMSQPISNAQGVKSLIRAGQDPQLTPDQERVTLSHHEQVVDRPYTNASDSDVSENEALEHEINVELNFLRSLGLAVSASEEELAADGKKAAAITASDAATGPNTENTTTESASTESANTENATTENATTENTESGDTDKKEADMVNTTTTATNGTSPTAVSGTGPAATTTAGADEGTAKTMRVHAEPADEGVSLGLTMRKLIEHLETLSPLSEQDRKALDWYYAKFEYLVGDDVDKASLSSWSHHRQNRFTGRHSWTRDGMSTLVRGLDTLPSKLDVRFKTVVNVIEWEDEQAQVTLENGEQFNADRVIVTTPLGCLKRRNLQFIPDLPQWKLDSIDRLEFGVVNKVILLFDKPFWDDDVPSIIRVTGGGKEEKMRGECFTFQNQMYRQDPSGKPLIVGLISGQAAQGMAQRADHEIVDAAVEKLRRVFHRHPNVKSARLVESIVTRWQIDRFSRGSYSHVGVEGTTTDHDLLARPVLRSLFFAGEATSRMYPGTIHGAYLSGLRAAKEVLNSLVGGIEVPEELFIEDVDSFLQENAVQLDPNHHASHQNGTPSHTALNPSLNGSNQVGTPGSEISVPRGPTPVQDFADPMMIHHQSHHDTTSGGSVHNDHQYSQPIMEGYERPSIPRRSTQPPLKTPDAMLSMNAGNSSGANTPINRPSSGMGMNTMISTGSGNGSVGSGGSSMGKRMVPSPESYEPIDVVKAEEELAELRARRITLDEQHMQRDLLHELGPKPEKPERLGTTNPYLLFQKDYWDTCRQESDTVRRNDKRSQSHATRNEIRASLGKRWRLLPDDLRAPYIELSQQSKVENEERQEAYARKLKWWETERANFRQQWVQEHQSTPSLREQFLEEQINAYRPHKKRTRLTE